MSATTTAASMELIRVDFQVWGRVQGKTRVAAPQRVRLIQDEPQSVNQSPSSTPLSMNSNVNIIPRVLPFQACSFAR